MNPAPPNPALASAAINAAGAMDGATHVQSALALLRAAAAQGPAVFSTSLGAEDMVVLDLIRRHGLPITMFTLDTGRLPEETYTLLRQVEERYGRCVDVLFPDAQAVQALVARDGTNGFRDSVENRKACCAVRKLEPLGRGLAGKRAWVTGLRAQQSASRAQLAPREMDAQRGVEKFNPLHDWSEAQVWDYLRGGGVPYNALHDRFYPSIGCAPCTRAVAVGEDIRAGRWWWENAAAKECGLHPGGHSVIPLRVLA
jgi:phosphoadenosine phosphosulfate reductase